MQVTASEFVRVDSYNRGIVLGGFLTQSRLACTRQYCARRRAERWTYGVFQTQLHVNSNSDADVERDAGKSCDLTVVGHGAREVAGMRRHWIASTYTLTRSRTSHRM